MTRGSGAGHGEIRIQNTLPGRAPRRFVVVGHRVPTSGSDINLNDLCGSSGRLDVLCRCVNSALFLSHGIRRDSEISLVLTGLPEPPRTVRISGASVRYLNPDERSTAALIRNALIRYSEALRRGGPPEEGPTEPGEGGHPGGDVPLSGEVRASPGIFVSANGLAQVLAGSLNDSEPVYLTESGKSVKEADIPPAVTVVLGDDSDLTPEEESILESHNPEKLSLGPLSLHSHHCISYLQIEIDRARS